MGGTLYSGNAAGPTEIAYYMRNLYNSEVFNGDLTVSPPGLWLHFRISVEVENYHNRFKIY
jgi:hypothetical protein